MSIKYQYLLPGRVELCILGIIAIAVTIIGNAHRMCDYYGLNGSDQLLKQSASEGVNSGLSQLDAFSFTNQVVTFLIWAIIGLLCFSIVQAMMHGYKEFRHEEELSSERYIHPRTFTRRAFWRQVIASSVTQMIGFILLAIGTYVFLVYLLPISLIYCRVFLLGTDVTAFGYYVLGLAILYIGLIILNSFVRVIRQRQRLTT
jgi:hypothetical protein